jgi:heavy metal translocating P-type ATPase
LIIAGLSFAAILLHLLLRLRIDPAGQLFGISRPQIPLLVALLAGGIPVVYDLSRHLARLELSSDLLAGISIVTAAILGEYLAGTLIVLMLSGGQTLEAFAKRRASSALEALARRLPLRAHRRSDGVVQDVPLDQIAPGDILVVLPHETCPVDGTVVEGRSTMDESYLTGEPYYLPKVAGSAALSGAINGEGALTLRADRPAIDSRYARIMQVMRESEQRRPRLRRLGDQLGALYTPLAVAIALAAWGVTGDASRFLAVIVVATPCPLLIAIPVAIIGSVSLAARRGIVIKDPSLLERVDGCRSAIFDKTGTLTYGQAKLTEILPAPGQSSAELLAAVASLEQYSRHPLAGAVNDAAREAGALLEEASEVSESAGEGLRGRLGRRFVEVTSRAKLVAKCLDSASLLPAITSGLECVVTIDGRYAGLFRFRDEPRAGSRSFIQHLHRRHRMRRVLLVSGDRENEVRDLAERVGIADIRAHQSPEEKLALTREETTRANTLFMGDGVNDAPALTAATVGIAFGRSSDVTAEAADAVILDSSLERVDELLHIGRRMRAIAMQSAVGGMALSAVGMCLAAVGFLQPVEGAVAQEVIDVLAVANALRAALTPKILSDY